MGTCGRHRCAERSLSLFLNQDYEDRLLLIYQNSEVQQTLHESVDTSKVLLVNNHIDSETGKRYQNLGAIYRDALSYIPEDVEVISFWDDDDLFLTDHISQGAVGYLKALSQNKIAYKPQKSYNRYMKNPIGLVENTLEPSIFVKASHIREYGFSPDTTEQHLKWVHPLTQNNQLLVDPEGKPTLIYNWGDDFPTWKTSGDFRNPENFNNYRNFSQDHGDRILTPHDVSYYYTLV